MTGAAHVVRVDKGMLLPEAVRAVPTYGVSGHGSAVNADYDVTVALVPCKCKVDAADLVAVCDGVDLAAICLQRPKPGTSDSLPAAKSPRYARTGWRRGRSRRPRPGTWDMFEHVGRVRHAELTPGSSANPTSGRVAAAGAEEGSGKRHVQQAGGRMSRGSSRSLAEKEEEEQGLAESRSDLRTT